VTGFVLLAGAMALVAGGLVAWPLLRHVAPSRALGVTLMAGLPLAAGAYYAATSAQFWRQPHPSVPAGMPDPRAMVASLEAKLRARPDDPAGWMMLGRSYLVLQDPGRAVAAYERAVALTGERDVEALIGLGEALVAGNEAEFTGRAGPLFERSLELAPDDARALWYGGIVSMRRGDRDTTRQRWQRLAAQDVPAEVRAALERAITSLDGAVQSGSTAAATP
jgi:cytochrome c-type biogenesis protein CcmH